MTAFATFTCPQCGRVMPKRLFNCPACGAFLVDMEEKRPVARAPAPWNDVVLLLAALPVLAPSLLLSWLDPKRLGKLQLAVHALGAAAVFAWLCGGSLSASLWVLSAGAAALLAVRRKDRLAEGIFLGFSGAAALRLVAGMLFIAGLFRVETWFYLGRNLSLGWGETVTREGLLAAKGAVSGTVTLRGAELDTGERLWRAEVRGGTRFYRLDPRTPVEIRSAREVIDRKAELLGLAVSLLNVPVPTDRFTRTDVSFRADGGVERDRATRTFGPVPETGGQLWLASVPLVSPPPREIFPPVGLLVNVYNDAAFVGEFLVRSRDQLSEAPLTVLCGVTITSPVSEAWTPVMGTDRRVWLAAPGSDAGSAGDTLSGAVIPGYWAAKLLRDHLARAGGVPPGEIVVLLKEGTQGFNEYSSDRLSVTQNDFRIVLVPILLLLSIGAAFLAAGVRQARRS